MKKSSLGQRSSSRFRRPSGDASCVRKSGIPLPRGRAQSSERQSTGQYPGNLTRANSASNLLAVTPGRMKSGIPHSRGRDRSLERQSTGQYPGSLSRASNASNLMAVTPGRTPLCSGMGSGMDRPSRTTSFGTSSIGGQVQRRDTRPLQDKSWQAEALSFIENVLWQYPMCSDALRSGLKSISLTNFIEACNVLLNILDKNIEITKANYLKELPFLLGKKMQYKGKIEKSWMIAISSPTAIPYAIGVLHFLAVCANIALSIDIETLMFPPKFDGESSDKNFQILVPFLNRCYKLKSTNPENYHVILEELKEEVLKKHYEQDGALTRYNQFLEEKKVLESQLEKSTQEKNLLNTELMAEQNHRKSTIEKIQADEEGLAQTRASIASYQTVLDDTSRAISVCKNEVVSLKEEYDCLSKEASELKLPNKQIDNIKKRRESLERDIVSNEKYVASYRDMIFAEEVKIIGSKNEIEQITRESNLKMMKYVSVDTSLEQTLIPQKLEEILEISTKATFNYEEYKAKVETQTAIIKTRLSETEIERKRCEVERVNVNTTMKNRLDRIDSLKEERNRLLLESEKERKDNEEELQQLNLEHKTFLKQLEDGRIDADKTKKRVERKRHERDVCEKMLVEEVEKRTARATKLMDKIDNEMSTWLKKSTKLSTRNLT